MQMHARVCMGVRVIACVCSGVHVTACVFSVQVTGCAGKVLRRRAGQKDNWILQSELTFGSCSTG